MPPQGRAPAFETKSSWAYRRLREMIADGELAPGSRLVLKRLADSLGLSEMPVREALRMLQRDGLIDFESHRGATVVPISREAVLEGVAVRMWLEVLATREATTAHTKSTLERLDRTFAELANAAGAGDPLRYSGANRKFHEAVEAPAFELLRSTINELWDRAWQARRTLSLYALDPPRIDGAQREHQALYDAVCARDAERAAAVMDEHRRASVDAWRTALGLDG